MRIRVIGAGVAGLSFALAATTVGYQDVLIFEEHHKVGIPKHCTGLVSESTVQSWGNLARKCTVNKFYNYIIRDLKGQNILYLKLLEPVYLLDRVKLEEELANAVLSAGGTIKFRQKVRAIRPHSNILVNHYGSHIKYDITIVCEGASRVLARNLGFYGKPKNLVGIQHLALLDKSPETVIVYADRKVSHNFFGWCVPVSEKIALVGAADLHGPTAYAGVLRIFHTLEKEGYHVRDILEKFGGLIPVNLPSDVITNDNVVLFGDAASLIKPLTGGGLYAISRISQVLIDVLKKGDLEKLPQILTASINIFRRRFKLHSALRDTLITLGGYGTALKIFSAVGIHSIKIKKYDEILTSMRLGFR